MWHKWAAHSAGRHCLEPSPRSGPCSGRAQVLRWCVRSRLEQLEKPATQRADLGLWPSARRCFPVADDDEQTGLQNLLGARPWPRGRLGAERCSGRFSCAALISLISRPHRAVLRVPRRRCHQYADHQRRHRSSRAMPPPSPHPCVTNRHASSTPTRRVHVQAAGHVQRLGELMTASQLVARKAAPPEGRATAAPCAHSKRCLRPRTPPRLTFLLRFERTGGAGAL